MSKVIIGGQPVGSDHPVFVIAEIGINHNGDIELVRQLIDVAAEARVDAVKFQKRTLDVVYTPEELARPKETPWGMVSYREYRERLEFGQEDYSEIDRYCKRKGILWFASCWDEGSVDFIEQFDPPAYKIASASLTDDHLLQHIRVMGKPIILSTGMSTMGQIEHAVKVVGEDNLVILHCTSTYPARPEELNLRVIQTLQRRFPNVPIGYSGHEVGLATTVVATVLGAVMVERHITLDRAMWGSDQAASVESQGFKRLVRDIRVIEIALGDGIKRVYDSELPIQRKLRRVR